MSDTQTVVDVIISGSTATVVDTRIDGVTTVAGAAPVTNVSGQVPDLGVNTDILATEGDILSLTNDVANLRANLIVTGNTLTDEIGTLSGELLSTGNNLEFKISNLSGDLIASGNNLDSLRDILSGNLITTGQTLTADLNTLSGNLNSRILSTGEIVDDISGNLITTGQTLTNLIGGNDTDISQLKTATGELQDKKFDKTGGTISGSILPNQSGTLSLGSEALPFLSGHFKDLTVSNNTLFIGEVPIHSSNGGIDFRSATGVTEFQDVSIRNLTVTGTEVIIDVEHLGVKDNTIVINSGEQGAGITAGSGGIVIDRGTLPDADIIFNETNDRFEIDFPLSVENSLVVKRNETGHFAESSNLVQTGQTLTSSIASSDSSINTISGNLVTTGQTLQTQITSNDNDISTLTSNIVTTGQTLQTQITSNDSDISTLSSNLVTTGQTLTSEIASVSGLISGSDNANSRIDTLSGNVIETGQYLEDEILVLSGIDNQTITDLIATGQTLTAADNTLANNLYITGNRNEQIIKQTGDTLSEEVATVSGLITSNDGDIAQLKTATGVLKTTTETNASNLVSTGQYLTSQISIVSGIAGGTDVAALSGRVDTLSGNLITTGQTLQTQITSNDSDISTLTSNLITTGQTLTSEIAIVSGLTTGSSSDPELSGKVDTLSGNLITTGQTLQTQITSNDSDISTLTSNLITTGQTLTADIATVSGIAENHTDVTELSGKVNTISGNLITTGQTLQTQITSNDSDITSLTSNLVTTGQTLTTDITTVSGLIVDNDGDITALKSATGVLKTSTDSNASNLITTGQTLQAQITSNDGDISTLTTNLGTTGQTLQTQITSNDSDISTLTSNLITTGQTLTTDIGTVSGLITDNDADITALKNATGVLKTSTDANTTNLITTGQTLQTQITSNDGDITTLTSNLVTTGQTLQTQITSNDSDISTLTTNLGTTGQTLQAQITSNDSDITNLTSNLIATGQTLTTDINTVSGLITDNDADITALKTATGVLKTSSDNNTANLITTGQTLQTQITSNDGDITTLTSNLATTGQTLQTQITSNDGDITTLTSNLVTTGQTLTTNINTVATNLGASGQTLQTQITSNDSDISTLTSNLGTTGQTLQTQITSNDSDIASLTTNLGTTGQTLQTQITSNDSDISTLDSTTVKLTTNQSIAGNKIFTNDVTINNLTVTGTEVIVDVENLAVKDNIIQINSGESGAGISAISGGIVIDRGTATNANILYNDANDRFELNFPLAVEGEVVASASNLITTGQTLTTNIDTVSTNLGTSGQTLQTQITSNDTDISTLTTNLGTTGQTLQTQITSNDSDISTLTTNLGTTGQTLQTQITSNDSDISTLTSNLVTTGQTLQTQITSNDSDISTLTTNLGTTGQTLQAQITSNDSDISTLTSNLVTTGQTLTTNINTVSTNLGTSGQTLQTQITSNDTDITNLSSNLVTTGQTLTTNINTVATNLVTTGQTLTSEIATVSGLIPATVIDGGGTANTVPLWSDANTIGDSVISQSNGKIGIGDAAPDFKLHVNSAGVNFVAKFKSTDDKASILIEDDTTLNYIHSRNGYFSLGGASDAGTSNLTINSSNGNVGIGTNNPSVKLHVEGTGDQLYLYGGANNNIRFYNGWLQEFSTTGGSGITSNIYYDGSYRYRQSDVGVHLHIGNGEFDFRTSASGTAGNVATRTQRMVIANDGNVGIGTNAPSRKFMIFGGSARMGIKNTTEGVVLGLLSDDAGYLHLNNGSGTNTIQLRGDTVSYFNAGSVGIGTNSPTARLNVKASGSTVDQIAVTHSGNTVEIAQLGQSANGNSGGALLLKNNGGTDKIYLDAAGASYLSGGAVGVGTVSPNAGSWSNAVTIQGASSVGLELMKGSSLYAFMGVQGSGSGHALDIAAYQNQSIRLRVGSNAGTTAVTILNDGKVGIGTTSPTKTLHVVGYQQIDTDGTALRIKRTNSTYGTGIVWENSTSAEWEVKNSAAGGNTGELSFRAWDGSAFQTKVVFAENGNVGIGVADPDQSLEVAGAIKSAGAYGFYAGRQDGTWSSFGTGVPTILLRGTANNSRAGAIHFNEYDGNTTSAIYSTDGTDGYGFVMAAYQGDIKFATGSLSGYKMVILSGGSVGIGTNAPSEMLHINKSSGTGSFIRFQDTGGGGVYIGARSNVMELYAGGAERMRIASDGNVGVGETSPDVQLHVKSSSSTFAQVRVEAAADGYDSSVAYSQAGSIKGISGYDDSTNTVAIKYGTFGGSGIDINSSGNVGIGTNSPAHKLEVYGGGGGTFGAITNRQSANANTDGISTVSYDSGNQSLRLWVDASGNRYLNAGTTAVISFTTTAVNIRKATTFSSGRATFSGTAGADGVVLAGGESTSLSSRLFFDNGTAGQAVTILNNSGGMEFRTAGTPGSSSGVVKMTLSSAGNLGIGITPTRKFHVSGSAASAYLVEFTNTHATQGYGVLIKAGDDNNVTALSVNDKDGNEKLRVRAGGQITFANAFTFPTSDGSSGQTLQTDGSGNITWSSAGTGTISGSGTDNYIPRFNGTTALENSILYDTGSTLSVGTTSPNAVGGTSVLYLSGQSNMIVMSSPNVFNNSSYIRHWGTAHFQWQTYTGSNTGYIELQPYGGQVAIGMRGTTTTYNLHIGAFGADDVNTFRIDGTNGSSETAAFVIENDGANGKVNFKHNIGNGTPATKLTLDHNGNIGIGTNAPGAKLHVRGSDGYLKFDTSGADGTIKSDYNLKLYADDNNNNSSGYQNIQFYTAGANERMRITSDGNVGIGTNNALDKLDVYGTGAIFRNLSDNADSVQIVRGTNHNASPDAKFYIYDNSSADWAAKINLDGASYGLDIQNGSDYFLLCRKAGGDRLLEVHGSSTIVNEDGIDYDFRVESNNDDYLLFTEGSTDRVAISTTAPAAKLHVEGDFKVGTTNNGNWMGYKDVSLNGNTYTTALTINLNNHTGCYVKLFLSGDWSSHSAVAFVGEYFIQNGSDGYAEPGTVISEFDNTNTDSIESKIVDPSSDTFTIQLKLSTAANGTLGGKLSYHVMGMATAVS